MRSLLASRSRRGSSISGVPRLPAASEQTLLLSFDGSLGGSTFSRASNAWNPETGALVTANVPRYVTGKGFGSGILLEEYSIQLLTSTENFDTGWSGVGADITVSKDQVGAYGVPDTAWKILSNIASSNMYKDVTLDYNSVTLSIIIKKGNLALSTFAVYNVSLSSQLFLTQVNWSTSPVSINNLTGTGALIRPLGNNGFYLVSFPITTGISIGDVIRCYVGFDMQDTEYTILQSVQLEILPYPTSYIPNTATSGIVQRVQEKLTHPTAGYLTPSQGTVMVWIKVRTDLVGTKMLFEHYTSPGINLFQFFIDSSGLRISTSDNTGASSSSPSEFFLSEGWHHVAFTWSASELVCYLDGEKGTPVSNPKIPSQLDTIFTLGSSKSGSLQIDQPIDKQRMFSRPLTQREISAYYRLGM